MFNDSFSKYYADELEYLNIAGQEFSAEYPQLANSLGIDINQYFDPHLKKLIQSFAFLTAKIKQKIDTQFEYIPSQLIQLLHPSIAYESVSCTIMQFESDNMQKLDQKLIPAGTRLKNQEYIFSTTTDITLTNINILDISLEIGSTYNLSTHSLLKLDLSKINCNKIKFFINDSYENSLLFFKLLFQKQAKIYFLDKNNNQTVLTSAYLKPCFEPLELEKNQTDSRLQEIKEFCHYYKSKLFFEIHNLNELHTNEECSLLITLSGQNQKNHFKINKQTLLLNCITSINLFADSINPLIITNQQIKYSINSAVKTKKIHSIKEVSEYNIKGNKIYDHFLNQQSNNISWIAQQEQINKTNQWTLFIHNPTIDFDKNNKKTLLIKAYQYNVHTNRIKQNSYWNLDIPISGLKCKNITNCSNNAKGIPNHLFLNLIKILHTQYLSRAFSNNPIQLIKQLCSMISHVNVDHVGLETYIQNINITQTAIYKRYKQLLLPTPCMNINIQITDHPAAFLFGHIIGQMFQKIKPINIEVEYNIEII